MSISKRAKASPGRVLEDFMSNLEERPGRSSSILGRNCGRYSVGHRPIKARCRPLACADEEQGEPHEQSVQGNMAHYRDGTTNAPLKGGACHGGVSAPADSISYISSFVKGACLSRDWRQSRRGVPPARPLSRQPFPWRSFVSGVYDLKRSAISVYSIFPLALSRSQKLNFRTIV